jgi:hypothetical protein
MSVPMIELNNLGGNQWEAVLVFGSGPTRAEVRYHFTDPQRSPGDFDSAVRRGAHAVFSELRKFDVDAVPPRHNPQLAKTGN